MEQVQHGVAAVAHQHSGAVWHPAAPFQGFADAENQRTIVLIQVLAQQQQQDTSQPAGDYTARLSTSW